MSTTPGATRPRTNDGDGLHKAHRPAVRRETETKASFKTTEFFAFLAVLAGILIAASIVDESNVGGFGARQAWLYITILTVGYMVSRGLAKSGSRDPYTNDDRYALCMPKAIWNDTVLAESDDTVVVEGNHYFPREAIKDEHFAPSEKTTWCPWKGTASYFTVRAGDTENPDAAWYYPDPKKKAEQIRDRVAFWRGVTVT